MCSPSRGSETKHEDTKEELPTVKPAAKTTTEPVTQTKQEETVDMVGFNVTALLFAVLKD